MAARSLLASVQVSASAAVALLGHERNEFNELIAWRFRGGAVPPWWRTAGSEGPCVRFLVAGIFVGGTGPEARSRLPDGLR
jgi:hypothetical protein